jgi:ATP adenylyltransferase
VADHYHVHVVPRWRGDTNFMTVTGDVRIVPEDLAETRRRLAPLFSGAGA